jgi:hypothetical protein
MSEHVRVYLLRQPAHPGPAGNAPLHDARPESGAANTDEYRLLSRGRQRSTFAQPALKCINRIPSYRDDARFAAFAHDPDGPVAQVEIPDIQPKQFSESQPRRVKQFHDGLVAHVEAVVTAKLQQACHGVGIQGRRQSFLRFWRTDVRGRILFEFALPDQVAKQAAHR